MKLHLYFFAVAIAVTRLPGQTLSTSFSFGGSGSVVAFGYQATQLLDTAQSIAVDNGGNVIVAGTAFSRDFPQTHALTQVAQQCNPDCGVVRAPFVAKLDATGSSLVYSTLLGAPSSPLGNQEFSLLPTAVAVDAAGNAYVTGTTGFPNFPTAKGGTLSPLGGLDAFLIKLDPNGNVIYSTLFGTSNDDAGSAIALGLNGVVHIVRTTTPQSLMPSLNQELFLTTLDALTGRVLNAIDLGQGRNPQLALGPSGQVNIAATTGCQGCPPQVVVQRVDTSVSKILKPTYTGFTGAALIGLLAGVDGSLYIALDPANPTITHLDPVGMPLFTTTVTQLTQGLSDAFAIDRSGNLYLGGTAASGLPQLHSSQPSPAFTTCGVVSPSGGLRGVYVCGSSGFTTAINPSATALNWSTYVGSYNSDVLALATDLNGNVYAAGKDLALSGHTAGKPISIVKFTPQIPAITVTADSLTDAASYNVGLPYPRGLASIFLDGLSGTADVSVRVNGVLAPLLAIANTGQGQQINFQVPFEPNPDVGALVQISQGNNSIFIGAQRTPPGIFTLPDGTPAIQHAADYSLVTAAQPAMPGETIIIYATGLIDGGGSSLPDGTPFPEAKESSAQVYVAIGETRQQVFYAGRAPGLIGVYQINCETSPQLASGLQILTVTSGNQFINGLRTVSKPVTLFVR